MNTPDDSIAQHWEFQGMMSFSFPVTQYKIYSRSNPAIVEQTEMLTENQEKERSVGEKAWM